MSTFSRSPWVSAEFAVAGGERLNQRLMPVDDWHRILVIEIRVQVGSATWVDGQRPGGISGEWPIGQPAAALHAVAGPAIIAPAVVAFRHVVAWIGRVAHVAMGITVHGRRRSRRLGRGQLLVLGLGGA